MKCPKCKGKTRVLDTNRLVDETLWRKRICTECAHQFSTKQPPDKPERLFVREEAAAQRLGDAMYDANTYLDNVARKLGMTQEELTQQIAAARARGK